MNCLFCYNYYLLGILATLAQSGIYNQIRPYPPFIYDCNSNLLLVLIRFWDGFSVRSQYLTGQTVYLPCFPNPLIVCSPKKTPPPSRRSKSRTISIYFIRCGVLLGCPWPDCHKFNNDRSPFIYVVNLHALFCITYF